MKNLTPEKFFLLLALCVLPLAVSSDSLNLDEGDTAMYALQPDFHEFCHRLMIDRQADCQMPLAMLAAWFGGEVLGTKENWEVRDFNNHGEWQLRAVNLLWGAAALLALSRIGSRLKIPWLPLLLAVQPYFWYYLNEARPYALELGCGAWVLVALVEFILERAAGTTWAWTLAVAGFFTFCATMLAPLPVGATVLAGAWLAWRHGWRPERKAVKILLAGLAACVPVAGYYVLTLRHGAQGAQVWHVDAKFVAYVFYELTGMGGIGLSYADIREIARSPQLAHELFTRLPQLVLPAMLGLLLAAVFFLGLRRRGKTDERPLLAGIFLALAVTAGVFVAGSVILQKAFWARHYAPVFPFYVTLLGLALAGVWNHAQRWLRLLPLAACALLAWSALDFRFAPAQRKEDYRSAVQFVRPVVAAGRPVWWLASAYPAIFYGVDITFFDSEPGKLFLAYHAREDVHTLPPPDLIVVNKPDLHDPDGTVQKIIANNHYTVAARYQAFTVWTNSAAKPEAGNLKPD